jgi:hypothetical protein
MVRCTAGSGSSRLFRSLFKQLLTAAILVVGLSSYGIAQGTSRPTSPTSRQSRVTVQADSSFDLKLSQNQVERLKALQAEYTPRFKALVQASKGTPSNPPNYGRMKVELRKLRTEYQERYNAVLTKEQLVRFDSLAVATAHKVSKRQLDEAKQADKRSQLETRRRMEGKDATQGHGRVE